MLRFEKWHFLEKTVSEFCDRVNLRGSYVELPFLFSLLARNVENFIKFFDLVFSESCQFFNDFRPWKPVFFMLRFIESADFFFLKTFIFGFSESFAFVVVFNENFLIFLWLKCSAALGCYSYYLIVCVIIHKKKIK